MRASLVLLLFTLLVGVPTALSADVLTRTIQKDLMALGYEPGNRP